MVSGSPKRGDSLTQLGSEARQYTGDESAPWLDQDGHGWCAGSTHSG